MQVVNSLTKENRAVAEIENEIKGDYWQRQQPRGKPAAASQHGKQCDGESIIIWCINAVHILRTMIRHLLLNLN